MFKRIIQRIKDLNKEKRPEMNEPAAVDAVNAIHPNLLQEWLSGNIEISDIPDVFQLLLTRDEKIKLQVAKNLNDVVSSLSPTQLVKLDGIFRLRGSREWNNGWRKKQPEDLLNPLMSVEEKLTILGLSSFHPSGYFRENALRALSNMRTGNEIPYLLIRLNDWSWQVRNISKERLLSYVIPEYAESFVDNLPLVLRLNQCSRDKHDDIIRAVVTLLSGAESSQKLLNGLLSADPKARLNCYKIILQTGTLDNKSIISCLIKESNPYNRLFVLRSIQKDITSEEFKDISQLLLHDKFPGIRTMALEKLYEFQREGAVEVLEKSLFDGSQSVCYTARYLLSKHKKYDFAAIYRNAIQNNERIYAGIRGLGEVGKAEDSKIISRFLDSPEAKTVKASMNAMVRLNAEGYKEEIIEKLGDERKGISKAAGRILSKEIHTGDAEDIYRIYKQSTLEHVKINCCELLLSLNKWTAIRYMIEFCSDENESVSALGQRAIEGWEPRYDYPFIPPSKKQIEELKKSLSQFGKFIKDKDSDKIEACIEWVQGAGGNRV